MIYVSKKEFMKSMFSLSKANALDVTGTGGSTLQSISVGVNQLVSSLSGQANLFKLPPIRFMHFTCIMSSSTEQTSPTYHSFLKIFAARFYKHQKSNYNSIKSIYNCGQKNSV